MPKTQDNRFSETRMIVSSERVPKDKLAQDMMLADLKEQGFNPSLERYNKTEQAIYHTTENPYTRVRYVPTGYFEQYKRKFLNLLKPTDTWEKLRAEYTRDTEGLWNRPDLLEQARSGKNFSEELFTYPISYVRVVLAELRRLETYNAPPSWERYENHWGKDWRDKLPLKHGKTTSGGKTTVYIGKVGK